MLTSEMTFFRRLLPIGSSSFTTGMLGFTGSYRSYSASIASRELLLKLEDESRLRDVDTAAFEDKVSKIRQEFDAAKKMFLKIPDALKEMPKMDPQGIYVNKNLRLDNIQVCGFDYDYTLAHYSANLQSLIYNLAKEHLVNELRYPASCLEFKYDHTFPIRGLYYDKSKGCLLKLDFFGSIEPDGCYFGRRKLGLKEIEDIYGTRHIGRDQARGLVGLMDIFCFSEACLIADIVQHFVDAQLDFDTSYVYQDVNLSIQHVHQSGLVHKGILSDPQRYLVKNGQVLHFLRMLKEKGKKLFLMTNSPYYFVDGGMRYMLQDSLSAQDSWRELFDVVIAKANKPDFYTSEHPFRCYDVEKDTLGFSKVDTFLPNKVYYHGCLKSFLQITKWNGPEVFKGGGNYKAAWYSANIISLSDGKAFLSYTDLQAEDGTGQLKEWVPLQGDCNSMPTVRIAHPTTVVRFDGIRKKRKAAVMDHSWSVGDRVDAWMQDCWREGVVKEKNKNDESTLTIDFPAIGDTSIVRAWHLRPTLTWQDGKWIEYSNPRQHSPSQGNIPQEKRARLSSPTEAKGKEQISQVVDLVESRKHDESRLLPVSENEKKFNIGKNTMHENKQDSRRTVRTGLLKEGSKVVFGVPEPGKKRKYMDVSKHYDSDRSKNTKTGYSAKNSNYAAPQVSGSRGWKNSTRIDSKEKQAAEVKPNVPKLGKPPSASSRTLSRKDNISTSIKSTSHDATETDVISGNAISNEEKDTGQDNLMEFGSVSDSQDTSEGQTLVSSLGVPRVASKKASSLNVRSERQNKGKSVPSGGRLEKRAELQEKLVSEVAEPRRSVRKIQPTSRLLEGLQTSLSVSKTHFGNDKGHRSQSRSKF